MNPNPLDGDRAAEAYDEAQGKQECKRILDAFHQGQIDCLIGRRYANPFHKSKERFRHTAYRNGYYGKRK